jgi:hypothetical protein
VALGSTTYHHQDGGIPSIVIGLILLNHGSMVDERDQYIFNKIAGKFANDLHYFKVGIT